ncbi:MAG TPA: hypothetical protein PLT66_02575, partial [Bacillota bacterium]|nr:hypothetical protein [Bacillota bacterium]
MKNTNTVRTLSFALAAIMLFSAALLGGAYALAMNESAQPYEQDGFTPYIGSKIPSKTVYISTYEHDTMLNSWISNDFIASDSAAKEVVISYEAMTFEESADAFAPGQSALKFMFEHISNGAFEAVVLSISEDGTAFIIRLDSSYTQLSADWYSATDGFDFDVFQSAYDNRVLSLTGEAPSTQTEMQMKFSVYNHVSADGATLTLFSQKQAQTLHESTDNALTYDEVLFLMNDSIKLYETYDTVCLTNAFEYGFVPDDIVRQSESHYVECLHTDYSSLSYNSANAQYLQKIRDISLIVRYRLLMLDSGFEKGYITLDSLSGMYGFSQKLYLGDAIDEIKNERRESFYFISSHFQFANDCYVMLIDTKGELDTAEKYAAALAEEFEACSTAWYDPYSRSYSYPALADAELEYPLIVLSDGYIFNQTCVFYKNSAVCVPTPELADKDPHKWKLTESYFDTDHIVISLTGNDQFGSVVLADIKDDDAKALIDMLKNAHTADMYLLQSTLYAVDSLFYYELYLNNGTTIILPVNDPSGELAAIEPSNSEYETSYFNKCVSLQ